MYFLKSVKNPDITYVGYTTDLRQRFQEHNAGRSIHTAKYMPWSLEFYCAFRDESKAISFEKFLKSGSGKEFSKKRFW